MLFHKRKSPVAAYDKGKKIPTIRSSIWTGEQAAGFKDPVSGKFDELMLIRNGRDLREFLCQYQEAMQHKNDDEGGLTSVEEENTVQ